MGASLAPCRLSPENRPRTTVGPTIAAAVSSRNGGSSRNAAATFATAALCSIVRATCSVAWRDAGLRFEPCPWRAIVQASGTKHEVPAGMAVRPLCGIAAARRPLRERFYCRNLCLLGAALAIPPRMRMFESLKRYRECAAECHVCARRCTVQAIHPPERGQRCAGEPEGP